MIITATELKYNLGKYLKLVDNEHITIKENDNIIDIIANQNKDILKIMKDLQGILPQDIDEAKLKKDRLLDKWESI